MRQLTIIALHKSILHWEEIYVKPRPTGSGECALCQRFNGPSGDMCITSGEECPIYRGDDRCGYGSTYHRYLESLNSIHGYFPIGYPRARAKVMIRLLISKLPLREQHKYDHIHYVGGEVIDLSSSTEGISR